MKAVIVELKDNTAVVLTDDGRIVKIRNIDYEIGQVVPMKNNNTKIVRKIAAFAVSAAAMLVVSVGAWAYASPYSYVSLDVNPSIEYTLNRFDRVLKVKAVNDDGEEIINEINLDNLENKTIQEALLKTVEQITEAGYFDGTTEGGIVITTSGKDIEKAEELAEELQETVTAQVDENGDEVIVEASSVGLERVEQAKELGVTPGKLNLVEKLQASSADPDSIKLEDWLNKPVKEIMKAAKDNKKASSVSGSAITFEEADQKKADGQKTDKDDKDLKKAEKEAEKIQKAEEKTNGNSQNDKSDVKAVDKNQKSEDKAQKTEDKALEKEEKNQDKGNSTVSNSNKAKPDIASTETSNGNNGASNGKSEDNKGTGSDKNTDKKSNSSTNNGNAGNNKTDKGSNSSNSKNYKKAY